MVEKQEAYAQENYFSIHVLLLKWSGIRLEPFDKNVHIAKKVFVVILSVMFVFIFPAMYVVDEALEIPNLELEDLTFNLSYCITHSLGEYSI